MSGQNNQQAVNDFWSLGSTQSQSSTAPTKSKGKGKKKKKGNVNKSQQSGRQPEAKRGGSGRKQKQHASQNPGAEGASGRGKKKSKSHRRRKAKRASRADTENVLPDRNPRLMTGDSDAETYSQRLRQNKVMCVICSEAVTAKTPVWTCVRCMLLAHHACIYQWYEAKQSYVPSKDAEDNRERKESAWAGSELFERFVVKDKRRRGRRSAGKTNVKSGFSDSSPMKRVDPWKCPSCVFEFRTVPEVASCFCGGQKKHPAFGICDEDDHGARHGKVTLRTPHSCGRPCGQRKRPLDDIQLLSEAKGDARKRREWNGYAVKSSCPHPCTLPCHPGFCPPCNRFVDSTKCPCGKTSRTVRCQDSDAVRTQSCGKICGRQLDCKKHICVLPCHVGPCSARPQRRAEITSGEKKSDTALSAYATLEAGLCDHREQQTCFCGGSTQLKRCGTGTVLTPTQIQTETEGQGETDVERKETAPPKRKVTRSFSCGNVCGKLLPCGEHKCTRTCHLGPCGDCSRTPAPSSEAEKCACGKKEFRSWEVARFRQKCSDPMFSCGEVCGKPFNCPHNQEILISGSKRSLHKCQRTCHDDACGPCPIKTKELCRCHRKRVTVVCGRNRLAERSQGPDGRTEDATATAVISEELRANLKLSVNSDVTCGHRCTRWKSCRRHRCGQVCCAIVGLEEMLEDQNDDGTTSPFRARIGHVCMKQCDRLLNCGKHKCLMRCHSGPCPPCHEVLTEGVTCECGETKLQGPVYCGTPRPVCVKPCSKLRPKNCTHRCLARCHAGACPPCMQRVTRLCDGGHGNKVVRALCSAATVSCGQDCGKVLECGEHTCRRKCHTGPCERKTAPGHKLGANPLGLYGKSKEEQKVISENAKAQGCGQTCGRALIGCGHQCKLKCHPGRSCSSFGGINCTAEVERVCECGRIKTKMSCTGLDDVPLSDVARVRALPAKERVKASNSQLLPCDSDCVRWRRSENLRRAFALRDQCSDAANQPSDLSGTMESTAGKVEIRRNVSSVPTGASVTVGPRAVSRDEVAIANANLFIPYPESFLDRVQELKLTKAVPKVEEVMEKFFGGRDGSSSVLQSKSPRIDVYNFKPMQASNRWLVHQLAHFYQLESYSQDFGTNRSVRVVRTEKSSPPLMRLSSALLHHDRRKLAARRKPASAWSTTKSAVIQMPEPPTESTSSAAPQPPGGADVVDEAWDSEGWHISSGDGGNESFSPAADDDSLPNGQWSIRPNLWGDDADSGTVDPSPPPPQPESPAPRSSSTVVWEVTEAVDNGLNKRGKRRRRKPSTVPGDPQLEVMLTGLSWQPAVSGEELDSALSHWQRQYISQLTVQDVMRLIGEDDSSSNGSNDGKPEAEDPLSLEQIDALSTLRVYRTCHLSYDCAVVRTISSHARSHLVNWLEFVHRMFVACEEQEGVLRRGVANAVQLQTRQREPGQSSEQAGERSNEASSQAEDPDGWSPVRTSRSTANQKAPSTSTATDSVPAPVVGRRSRGGKKDFLLQVGVSKDMKVVYMHPNDLFSNYYEPLRTDKEAVGRRKRHLQQRESGEEEILFNTKWIAKKAFFVPPPEATRRSVGSEVACRSEQKGARTKQLSAEAAPFVPSSCSSSAVQQGTGAGDDAEDTGAGDDAQDKPVSTQDANADGHGSGSSPDSGAVQDAGEQPTEHSESCEDGDWVVSE